MIELRNIYKSYNGNNIISDFSISIAEGERIAIMGKSGIGKTTLLNIIMGLVAQDSGTVVDVPDKKSMVFQENRLLNDFSAYDNISLICNVDKLTILQHFSELGLSSDIDKLAGEYSGGMKRRLAIMRAMLAESDIIAMDEPFKGLDGDTKAITIDYVQRYTKGKTFILVTHEQSEAKRLKCERIIEI